jgi:hypothetical protein
MIFLRKLATLLLKNGITGGWIRKSTSDSENLQQPAPLSIEVLAPERHPTSTAATTLLNSPPPRHVSPNQPDSGAAPQKDDILDLQEAAEFLGDHNPSPKRPVPREADYTYLDLLPHLRL